MPVGGATDRLAVHCFVPGVSVSGSVIKVTDK
jgi:hypothetical protein